MQPAPLNDTLRPPPEAVDTELFPWPPAEDESIVWSAVSTWRESALRPAAFFRSMPRGGGLGAALLYYLPLGVLVAAINLFWQLVLPVDQSLLARLGVESNPVDPLVEFLVSPLLLFAALFVAAAFTHAALAILGGARHGVRTTARVFCYSYSPAVLAVLPRIGGVIGFVWMLFIAVIGLREAHETTGTRAAFAVLLPVFLAMGLVVFAVLLMVAGILLKPVV
jgi:hypothetical protein